MNFFDGTWGRRQFISWYEGRDDRYLMNMSIEERNYLHDLYEGYLDQLISERENY